VTDHLGRLFVPLVDGQLGHDERDRAFAHLAVCPACQHEVTEMRAVKARLAALGGPALPCAVADRLLHMAAMTIVTRPGARGREPGRGMPVGGEASRGIAREAGAERAGPSAGVGPWISNLAGTARRVPVFRVHVSIRTVTQASAGNTSAGNASAGNAPDSTAGTTVSGDSADGGAHIGRVATGGTLAGGRIGNGTGLRTGTSGWDSPGVDVARMAAQGGGRFHPSPAPRSVAPRPSPRAPTYYLVARARGSRTRQTLIGSAAVLLIAVIGGAVFGGGRGGSGAPGPSGPPMAVPAAQQSVVPISPVDVSQVKSIMMTASRSRASGSPSR
jgi:hypothetical protein